MQLTMLKGKIHRAIVKQAELNYVGSITIDPELMEAAAFWNMSRYRLSMWKTETVLKRIRLTESRAAA